MLTIDTKAKLNSGHSIPMLGFGVFKIDDNEACRQAVLTALEAGYRHIDTAKVYWNEEAVGEAIRDSGIAREEIFVTTKVFIDDFGKDQTREAIEASLGRLGMDYVDLYLIHWPVDETMMGAWEAMQTARDEGKLRSIGVSNFTVQRFEEMWFKHTDEAPAANQVEFHPFWYRPDLLDYMKAKGIQGEGYSPLARAERMDDAVLKELAGKYGKTVAQIMIRWQLQLGMVVLPKSSHPERIRQNADVFDFEIVPEDMARINGLNEDLTTIRWRPSDKFY
jgi:diketogulonate reductase-like aldo/keto reductase